MATKDIGSLRTRLSFEDEGNKQGLEGLRRDLKGLRSEMNLARSGGREYSNSLKGMREQSDILSRTLKTQQDRVRELKHRYDESVKAKGEDANQTRDLASQYNNAAAQMNRTEEQLKRLNDEIKRQESPWTKLGDSMANAGDKMQKFGKGMTDFGKSYSMRVTAPIVASGVAVFKASMDYESAFAGVRKTVDATEEEFQMLSDGIREMTKALPASAVEIASVGEAAGQLGIETENILSFTRTMIDLGEATNMTSETAATEFARFANIVGMSQKDFDRLGSVVVDLGNNLATTEAEIVSMAMRLAGAGAQIGLTEAEIMAFAGSFSSVGIAAEAGGSAFSKVMINMQLAAELGGKELNNFAKVSGMSAKEFKKAFETDASGAIISFIKGLETAEDRGMSAIAVLDEMGITEVRMRDALLRAAGASDVFTDSIAMGSKAWEENTALTEEAEQRYGTTESQLKIMWNRLKDVAITMGDALVPAVMSAIDAAEPFIKQIENGAKAFSEMDKEQQQIILKMIALVAAVGPASMALGGLTTGIGGMLKVGGSVAKMLGNTAGKGLIGRIGLMGAGASLPVGLAIAGVTALGATIHYLTRDTEEYNEASFEKVNKMKEEIDATDELIQKFEAMQKQNRLTTDEMLEYMDILDELSRTSSPQKIQELTERQEDLLKKSGFTNEEMEIFLKLNDRVIDETPAAAEAISEQGNAYADNLSALKELNAEKREQMLMVAEQEILKGLREERDLLQEQKDLQEQITEASASHQEKHDAYIEALKEDTRLGRERLELESEMQVLIERYGEESEQVREIAREIAEISDEQLEHEKNTLDVAKDNLDTAKETLDAHNEDLESIDEQLKILDDLKYEYEALWLAHLDINAEKGQGLIAIDKEIERLKDEKKQLEDNTDEVLKSNDGYKKNVEELGNQIRNLEEAKGELENINELAAETAYEKSVDLSTNPTIEELNKRISDPIKKSVELIQSNKLSMFGGPALAVGTDFHQGGPALVGEEGPELARHGNRWSMLDFGITDLPRGTQVFTHDETKGILRALNRMPAYATGISSTGEANRIVGHLNNQQQVQSSQPMVLEIHVTSEIDGRVAGQVVERYVTEIQDRNKRTNDAFK
jgi:TP901 family phage tail tape measure protein